MALWSRRRTDRFTPVAGIVDATVANVQTSGYLPGPDDAAVTAQLAQRCDLRPGDAVVGAIPTGDRARPLTRVDTVNGLAPATARPSFDRLAPTDPRVRLRVVTGSDETTTRLIDLAMPVGKGQRALLVTPPGLDRTPVIAALARAIAVNHQECHLMVALVGRRPEDVVELRGSVKGEVLSAGADQTSDEQVALAELALERARRLVELGHDVVLLLDSISRLAHAYPREDQVLRLLGAGRAIENGGSLTVFAVALSSTVDGRLLEELDEVSNARVWLTDAAPGVDLRRSHTRKSELLLTPAELAGLTALRALDAAKLHELLAETPTNDALLTRATDAR